MRFDHTHTLKDEKLSIILGYLECKVEVSIDYDCGNPRIIVDAVLIDDKNLLLGCTKSQQIAADIADEVEDDDAILTAAIERDERAPASRATSVSYSRAGAL